MFRAEVLLPEGAEPTGLLSKGLPVHWRPGGIRHSRHCAALKRGTAMLQELRADRCLLDGRARSTWGNRGATNP